MIDEHPKRGNLSEQRLLASKRGAEILAEIRVRAGAWKDEATAKMMMMMMMRTSHAPIHQTRAHLKREHRRNVHSLFISCSLLQRSVDVHLGSVDQQVLGECMNGMTSFLVM